MVRLIGGAKAVQIESALIKCLAQWDPNYEKKLVGFSSDGASVMTGVHAGVAQKMRDKIPSLLNFHCICHKLALGANESRKTAAASKQTQALGELQITRYSTFKISYRF